MTDPLYDVGQVFLRWGTQGRASMIEREPIVIESPYAGDVERNLPYLQRCIKDSIERGEAPFASHQMYTQALDDKSHQGRLVGIECGYAYLILIRRQIFYTDLGWSPGMITAWDFGAEIGATQVLRALDGPIKQRRD